MFIFWVSYYIKLCIFITLASKCNSIQTAFSFLYVIDSVHLHLFSSRIQASLLTPGNVMKVEYKSQRETVCNSFYFCNLMYL